MQNKAVHYHLTPDAVAIVAHRSPSPKKRGAWISEAIAFYDQFLREKELSSPERIAQIERDVKAIKAKLEEL